MKKQILAAVLVAITVSLAAVVPAFADEEMLVDEEVAIEMGSASLMRFCLTKRSKLAKS